jgi:hypothetical protein
MRTQRVEIELCNGKIKTVCDGFVNQECDAIAEIENTLGTITSREETEAAYVKTNDLPEFVKQGF